MSLSAEQMAERSQPLALPLPDGIHEHVLPDLYHRRELGMVSKSALDLVHRSPAHYRAWADGLDQPSTPALAFGSALHMAVLEPQRFESSYAVQPDFGDLRTKAGKELRDTWRERFARYTHISADDWMRIKGMLRSIHAHTAASRLIADGTPEVTLRWTDPHTGLPCKSRADWWVRGKRLAFDLKSTADASPEVFARSVYTYRYFVQDALYRDAFAQCGQPIDHFAILAVEKEPPHVCAVYVLDASAVESGYAHARADIETLASCMRSGEWHGYSQGVTELSLPAWSK